MAKRSPSRHRALGLWLALLAPITVTGGCLTIPEDLDDPNADPAAPSTTQELLDRHIAASGGAEALRPLSQRTVEARVVFLAQKGCEEGDPNCVWEETTGQFVLYTTADGRMYRRMVVGDNILERGFDGEVGWQMQAQPQMLAYEDPAATAILREDALLHWYFDVDSEARNELALELLPGRKSSDGKHDLDGIRWFATGPATPESEKWFDRATGLLYEEIERDTETGDAVRRVYSEYREVDGVQVPWLIEQITEIEGYPDHVVELRMQVVHHRPVKDELFAIPQLAPAKPEPDLLLATLDEARTVAAAEPDDPQSHVQVARWAFAAVHLGEAKAAAERALKLDKDELEALYILARVAMLEGDTQAAERFLRQALGKGLRENEAARQMAWIHLRRGDWAKAAKALESAGHRDLAARYAAFEGKPLVAKMAGNGCMATLPISLEGGAVIVQVEADGDPLRLLFDTGASDLIISAGKGRSLVIATDAEAPLVAGGPPLRQGQIDTLTLGEFAVANVPVTMFPDEQFAGVVGIPGVDGVLGVRPFASRQVTVDIANKQLQIVETDRRCAKQLDERRTGIAIPIWLHETHYLYVHAKMNGAEGLYLLNTGMRGADLTANEGAYAHAGIGAPPMRPGQASLARVANFEIGDYAREDLGGAWGFLQQNATIDGFRLDGMLGLPVLGRGSWTLDFVQQRLYIREPSAAAPAPDTKSEPKPKPEPKPKSAPNK
jgi:tetratricopeptide (TPR) repeat protein